MADARVEFRNRIIGHGTKPADQFMAHPNNWRRHPQEQRAAMRAALEEVGWVGVVLENVRTGHLVDGHERVWEALQNGNTEVPYVQVDLSEEEEAYVLATFDPLGAMAIADKVALDAVLQQVQSESAAIQQLVAQTAERAGLYGDFPTGDEGLPDDLPAMDLEGIGELAQRIIIVFANEEEKADCFAKLGVKEQPNIIVYHWADMAHA